MKPVFIFAAIPPLLLAACGGSTPRPPLRHGSDSVRGSSAASATAPAAARSATVVRQEWPILYEATGTVRARATAAISSKVMGYVSQVNAQAGDRVTEGPVSYTHLDVYKRQMRCSPQTCRGS